MTIQDFQFSNDIHINTIYKVIDKKERQGFAMAGANYTSGFSYNGTGAVNGAGYVKGKTSYEYVLVVQNLFTNEVQEKRVTTDTFYKKNVNDLIIFDSDTQATIHNLKPALKSTDLAKYIMSELMTKTKVIQSHINEKNEQLEELNNRKFTKKKVQLVEIDLEFYEHAQKELKNAIILLKKHIEKQEDSWS